MPAVQPKPPAPQVPLTPEQKGDLMQVEKRYQLAIDAYKNVHPPSAEVWNKMGIAYQMMFNLKDAQRCYKESIKLDPKNSTTVNNLATGLFVGPGNDGNVLIGNTSNKNARGIFLNGAVGTVVLANTMTGNTDADARDALPGENTWIANRCVKEDNPGTLCALPAGPSATSDVSSGTSSGASAGTAGRGTTADVSRRPAVDQRGWPCLRVPVWDVDPIDGGAWVWITVVAPDAPAGTFCGS